MKKSPSKNLATLFEKLILEYEETKSKNKNLNQASGVVYTPEKIVNFVVDNIFKIYFTDLFRKFKILITNSNSTKLGFDLIHLILTKNPDLKELFKTTLENIKILDPACGTGRFLISIANYLFKLYQILNFESSEDEIKKKILRNNLFGVEIDKSAFTISKLRLINWLYSKRPIFLENNEKDLIHLNTTDIEAKICQFKLDINLFNIDYLFEFNQTQFDIIVGNPPYIENKKIKDLNYKKNLLRRFKSAYKLYDFSILFIEKSIEILKDDNGYLSLIMPNKFLAANYGTKIRKLLVSEIELKEIINISSIPVFLKTSIYPVIISFKNCKPNIKHLIKIKIIEDLKDLSTDLNYKVINFPQISINKLPDYVIPVTDKLSLIDYLFTNYKPISEVLEDIKIIYRPFGFIEWAKNFKNISSTKNSNKDLILIGTGNVGRFNIKFDKHIKIAKNDLKISYYKFNLAQEQAWKDLNCEKLIFREIATDLTWVYDPGLYANITGLYSVKIPSFNTNKLFCLLAFMNSTLLNMVFKAMYGTLHMSGGYLRFNGSFIKSLPIPDIFPDSISSLGKILQFLFQLRYDISSQTQSIILKGISKEIIERNIDFCDNLTNSLINQLYIKNPVFNELEKLLNSVNDIPNINFKYNIPHFKLPKFKIYNINELNSNFNKIRQLVDQLGNNLSLMRQIKKTLNPKFILIN